MTALLRPFSTPGEEPSMRIVRGEGAYLVDAAGRRYLDAAGGLWNVALGLANRSLVTRMQVQLEKLAYVSLFDNTHDLAEELASKLISLTSGLMHFAYLSTTGSSSIEIALTLASLYQHARGERNRTRVLSFDRGYHGSSYLARAASGLMQAELAQWGMLPQDVTFLPSAAEETRSLEALSAVLTSEASTFACLVMEPVLGSGGIIVPSEQYCAAVSELCGKYGVVLIADEVATGGGRCGSFLASTRLNLKPDIVALSKGLTAGHFPLGATLFNAAVIAPLRALRRPLPFGSTQDGNPVGCAAALESLAIIERDCLTERARQVGEAIKGELSTLIGSSAVSAVRGLGLMVGIELAHPNSSFTGEEVARVRAECRNEGLLVYSFDTGISLFPPLTISDDEVADMLDILREVLGRQF